MPNIPVPLDAASDLWLSRYCQKHAATSDEVMQEAVLDFLFRNAPDLLPDGEED
jgi:hypothetical protein